MNTSLLYSYSFPKLRCSDKASEVTWDSPDTSSLANFVDDDEISIAGFIEQEQSSAYASASGSLTSIVFDSCSRSHSVTWILKVRSYFGFQALTAYLAVNYLDRFLSSHILPQTGGWPLQLLSVACLSLAAKMEERLVPSLVDLQVEGAKFIFEPKTIQRMELLVLDVLDWRLRVVTPFTFISFFSYKLNPSGTHAGLLLTRSTDIILTNILEASFLEYRASSIAAAAILYAASELPNLSLATPEHAESWCDGLSKDKIKDCYQLMQQSIEDHNRRESVKVIPRCRVTAQINRVKPDIGSPSSSSSSSSTPSPSSYSNKRRKLGNNRPWVDDK